MAVVHRIRLYDGADAVVEEEAAGAGQARDFVGQRIAGKRPGGDNGDAVNRAIVADFLAPDFDARMRRDGARDFRREYIAVHRERMAAGNARLRGRPQHQRSHASQFLFQQPWRGVFLLGLQRIAAHQFRETIGLVCRRGPHRTHFVQHDRESGFGNLPGGFGARESSADDVYGGRHGYFLDAAAGRGPAPRCVGLASWVRSRKPPFKPAASDTAESPYLSRSRSAAAVACCQRSCLPSSSSSN